MVQLRSHPRLVRKLQESLGNQICVALDDASVVKMKLNPDSRLFIERLGHGIAAVGEMSSAAGEIVVGSVAHALQSLADDEQPIISGVLPIGGHRFDGFCRPLSLGHHHDPPERFESDPLDDSVSSKVMTAY